MVLVPIGQHIVLLTTCSLRSLLVFHDTVALVIDDGIPLGFEQLLVGSHVGIGSDNHALAALGGGGGSLLLGYGIQVTDVKTKILAVLHPVGDLLLTWSHKKDSALVLLGKSLGDTQTSIGLSCTCSVCEHIALAVCVVSVGVLLAKELCLGFQYVLLLLW